VRDLCWPGTFSLTQRTITTDPNEICPASCGLCGDPTPEPSAKPTSKDIVPTVEPTECSDIAEYSEVCRYSSTMCTCSEVLESTTCDVPYTANETFSNNNGSCAFELLWYDIREAAAVSEVLATHCEYAISYFQNYGLWPNPDVCRCFAKIPDKIVSVIFNCNVNGFHLIWVRDLCLPGTFSMTQRTITTDPNEICPASCGLCGDPIPKPTAEPSPDYSVPTVEPTECADIAEYSEACRYSSTMCTCSEILESTTCDEPYTANETFFINDGSCDLELLWYDIREAAAVSEVLATNCEDVISHFQNYTSWPKSETCLCFALIPDEIASVIFNCYVNGFHLIDVRDLCLPGSFSLTQKTITTDPNEICPASCGLCGNPIPEPTAKPTPEDSVPTIEPTECEDIAEYSEVCRYSSTMCTCSEILESTTCDVPYTANETFSTNEGSCDFELLWYDIREAAAVSEVLATNCEKVISYFQNNEKWPDPDVCFCFAYIPEKIASVIFNCYVNGFHLIYVRDLCVPGSFSLTHRTITTDPMEICPASCEVCRDISSECDDALEFSDDTLHLLCPSGFTGVEVGGPAVCNYWERLDTGYFELTSTIYQDSFERSLANSLFSSCSGVCIFDINSSAGVAYEWLSWSGCWKKTSQGICFDEYADEKAEAEDKVNGLCAQSTPSPEGCTDRIHVWNETIAERTCKLDHGATDKSASASVCDGYEDHQYALEKSLANRMFVTCRAWCVYNIHARAYEAFIWRKTGCWEPADTCVNVFVEEREAMTDYVDNILCASETPEPTIQPTCIPELEYSEKLMDEHCSVSSTRTTFKHYGSINREPVSCSGLLQDTLDLKKSIANELYDNCGAWCVFDWSTQALEAWLWTNSSLCWTRKSGGWCIFDNEANTKSQIWTEARAKLASSCNANTTTFCNKEYEWTQEWADNLCGPSTYGLTNKSYSGAYECSGDSERQVQLEKSLANKLYISCSSWCVYNWDTLIDDERDGFFWNNQNQCYLWVTTGACFNVFVAEYEATKDYVLETCTYINK